MVIGPKSKEYDSIGGHPVATTRSRSPHFASAAEPSGWMMWVESMSLGNFALSTTSTRYPLRAKHIAAGDPAQRAPITITSYGFISLVLHVVP